eukprot:scaffold80804_cov48-Attheya_sp.AAC.2
MGVQTPVRQDKLPSSNHIAEVFTGILSEDPSKSDERAKKIVHDLQCTEGESLWPGQMTNGNFPPLTKECMVWQGAQILKSLTSTSEASHIPQASMTAPPCNHSQRNHHSRVNPKEAQGWRERSEAWCRVLLRTGDEVWEEAAVEFYNKGKDRGYNRTGSAIRAHFHKLAFASAPTGQTVPPHLVQCAKDIKRDIDKEEVIGYANLNDDAIALCEVTSENGSGMTGTNLVDDNGEVRRPQPRNTAQQRLWMLSRNWDIKIWKLLMPSVSLLPFNRKKVSISHFIHSG